MMFVARKYSLVFFCFIGCGSAATSKNPEETRNGGAGGGSESQQGGATVNEPTMGGSGSENVVGASGGTFVLSGGQGGTSSTPGGSSMPPSNGGKSAADILGTGNHLATSVKLTTLATVAGCLNKPTDLAFNPLRPAEMWVVNYGDNSACIVTDATTAAIKSERRQESSHEHFMPRPMGLAFGGEKTTFNIPGTFATANDSAGDSNPDDGELWNGTTLYSSDLRIFGKFKGADGNSHLDMLHDSPLARGIAWEKDNIYWVFGSMFQDITRYDYVRDHERGNFDHGDGSQWHYVAGLVKGQNGVPSHLYYDAKSAMLYIADTGNKRVARLLTTSGTLNPKRHTRNKDRVETKIDAVIDGATLTDFVPASAGLQQPSGIDKLDNVVFVSDFATGFIYAFDTDGTKLNWLDTGLGAGKVAGLAVGPDRKLYFASTGGNTIHVVTP
jgi:hypothetical protein